jgi:hypothetical protein
MVAFVRDQEVSDLIDAAQSYSNPTGRSPSPPTISYPPISVEGQELERSPHPLWFEPIDHPLPDDDVPEVPVIDSTGEVAEPSSDDEAQISELGIDALAYYAPFHFYHRSHWGIYIRDYGIAHLTALFTGRRMLTRADNWALRCGYWFLFEHEYFHFQTELAATRYEVLTGDRKAYEQVFGDRHGSWLEEGMANARAHRQLHDLENAILTFPRIEHFRGFAARWMKTQPPGYRDYDRWCKSPQAMSKGRAALTSRLHEISGYLRHPPATVNPQVLRLYENADYSRVPVVRIHDSRIPWLKSGRLFPKAHGLQVMVYTREHPPMHIHVEFLGSEKSVRLGWPSLEPLRDEPTLSAREEKDLHDYMTTYRGQIDKKVQKVFQQRV